MKKILIILLLFYNILNANNNYELKLYEKVLPSIFKQTPIKIFADKNIKEILKYSQLFHIVDNCDNAVMLLVGKNFSDLSKECKNKPIFSTSYRDFKNNDNSFGAFYWRKGRPQIKFKNSVISKFNLHLPNNLKKYSK